MLKPTGRGVFVFLLSLWAGGSAAAARSDEYALILQDPPLASQIHSRHQLQTAAAQSVRQKIEAAQLALRRELEARHIHVTASAHTLVNAVFVRISPGEVPKLHGLPGVAQVVYQPPARRHMDRAVELIRAPGAWSALGGTDNAGAGIKIGILDTGIDQKHAAFQDSSLAVPPGFPKGRSEELPFTNRKVIVARSYVLPLATGNGTPEDSRPDDLSPRDRSGHGTAAAMIAAGARNSGPAATITGVAPKAFLGNYKIFGTPGINDTTLTSVIVNALEDALQDGMDVVMLAVGQQAVYGPLDPSCSTSPDACDVRAQAIESAARLGMPVVVSAGNDGDIAQQQFPTLNSLHSPGTAPSAITAGASINSHVFFSSVSLPGGDVPSNLQRIDALLGDGPKPPAPLIAPLRDVSADACSALADGSLSGAIALIQRGNCSFATKVNNAQKAGATGAIIYRADGSDVLFPPEGLAHTGIPMALIGSAAGGGLKSLLQSSPDHLVTLDPALQSRDAPSDTVADFSSRGPSIGHSAIKPELVAPGKDLYTATESSDPNGDLYDATGYTSVHGTSFAAAIVSGVLALVEQQNPGFGPGQLKSAVVNTAADEIAETDGTRARVTAVGAGKVNATAAIQPAATMEPSTLSFGVIETLPLSQTLRITNTSSTATSFSLAVVARDADPRARLSVSPTTIQLNAGASGTVTVRLDGSRPNPGSYEGAVTVQGGGRTLRVPYLYLVGDGAPFNIFPVLGDGFVGVVNTPGFVMAFKVLDRYGAPVAGLPVQFLVSQGGGKITGADPATDVLGIAAAEVTLGSQVGEQQFTARAGGLTVDFFGQARLQPTIAANGVVNAASFEAGRGLAPGSYISILGAGLSDATRGASTASLPYSMAGVSVSFDAPQAKLSLPGRLSFVSDSQINVQVPWELQGLDSVVMKVSIGDVQTDLYTVPLNDYSPGVFAIQDSAFRLVSGDNPARRGATIVIYANGLGPVTNQPATGEPSPAEPLARARVNPTVTIGGVAADVLFSGLTPGSVGLYQLNVVAPDVPSGMQPLVISVNGIDSKPTLVPVE